MLGTRRVWEWETGEGRITVSYLPGHPQGLFLQAAGPTHLLVLVMMGAEFSSAAMLPFPYRAPSPRPPAPATTTTEGPASLLYLPSKEGPGTDTVLLGVSAAD